MAAISSLLSRSSGCANICMNTATLCRRWPNAGRESRNFDPYIREPAGLFVQTADGRVGWVLFDGRQRTEHRRRRSRRRSDSAAFAGARHLRDRAGILRRRRLGHEGRCSVDTDVDSGDEAIKDLKLLNRVAAGSRRNRPGADPDGLNLYRSPNVLSIFVNESAAGYKIFH